jgi:hypothetical protein
MDVHRIEDEAAFELLEGFNHCLLPIPARARRLPGVFGWV